MIDLTCKLGLDWSSYTIVAIGNSFSHNTDYFGRYRLLKILLAFSFKTLRVTAGELRMDN